MITRKNIIAYLLTCSLCMPFFSQLLLQKKTNDARSEMEKKLEQATLTTLSVPVTAIEWVVPGKEIIVNGRLFDIKSQHTENGRMVVTGLYDDEEKALKDVAAGHQHHEWLNNLLQKMFSGSYDHHFPRQPAIGPLVNTTATEGSIVIKKHAAPFTRVAAPPPWLV